VGGLGKGLWILLEPSSLVSVGISWFQSAFNQLASGRPAQYGISRAYFIYLSLESVNV
jgi:hypothetical protein